MIKALWEIMQRASPYSRTGYGLSQGLRSINLELRLKFYSGNKVESESSPVFPGQHYLPATGVALDPWGCGGE